MAPRFPAIILLTGFLGCARPHLVEQPAHSPPASDVTPQNEELKRSEPVQHSYSLGMSRVQVRAELADSYLFASATRPATGWTRQVSPPAGREVLRFESSHPDQLVQSCDVYRVGHRKAPSMYYGIRLDYFYFDRDDKLIGFNWIILD